MLPGIAALLRTPGGDQQALRLREAPPAPLGDPGRALGETGHQQAQRLAACPVLAQPGAVAVQQAQQGLGSGLSDSRASSHRAWRPSPQPARARAKRRVASPTPSSRPGRDPLTCVPSPSRASAQARLKGANPESSLTSGEPGGDLSRRIREPLQGLENLSEIPIGGAEGDGGQGLPQGLFVAPAIGIEGPGGGRALEQDGVVRGQGGGDRGLAPQVMGGQMGAQGGEAHGTQLSGPTVAEVRCAP